MKSRILLSLGVSISCLFSTQVAVANEVTEKLDRIVTVNTEQEEVKKEVFVWNTQGLLEKHTIDGYEVNQWTQDKTDLLTVIDYVYNDLKQVVEKATEITNQYGTQTQKVEYGYDDNGVVNDVINSSNFGWGWNYTSRMTTTRDADGLLTDSINYYGSPENWNVSDKLQYQYDDKKRLKAVEVYTPNFVSGDLVLFTKETYTYDTTEDGQTRRVGLAQQHTDDSMEPVEEPTDMWEDEQITNATGLVIFYEKASWTEDRLSKFGIEKYTTVQTTNPMGAAFSTQTNYTWPWGASDWAVSTVIDESRSGTGWGAKTITRTEKKPNPDYDPEDGGLSSEFLKTSEITYGYGMEWGPLSSEKSSVWTNGVEATEELIYNYDEEVEINQVYIPEFYTQAPYLFTNRPTRVVKYEGSGFNMTLLETATYHYSAIGEASIPAVQANNDATVYFVENTLNVETPNAETISVYSLSGNVLYTVNKVAGAASFNTPLTQGIYIVKGSTGWAVKTVR